MTATVAAECPLPVPQQVRRRPLAEFTGPPGTRLVVVAPSKDDNAKVTLLVLPPGAAGPAFAVKLPTTERAAAVVEREGRFLVDLRRMRLRELERTLPRFVAVVDAGERIGLVATAMPGTPMSTGYHAWRHTARRTRVQVDFRLAADWLARFQAATAGPRCPVGWLAELRPRLAERFAGAPELPAVLDGLAGPAARLRSASTPRTVVHGDFWCGNLLVSAGAVSGVVDWEAGRHGDEPLRDLARFALAYALYLDRHSRPGARVAGHRGLRATGWGAGIRYAVTGAGWFPELFRDFLRAGLERLGAPAELWPEVALAGIAEVAAGADHAGFAGQHFQLLTALLGPARS